ncbi:MAG TPA: hypothetical protein ENK25_00110 [Bacteroidetes bacterium]|nr:hypothetical protein [Bacteroidota bacterium]
MGRRNLLVIIAGLVVAVTLMSGCKKKKKDEPPQDIIPKILDFRGPTVVTASGLEPLEYKVAYQAGSKYTFTPVGYEATVEVPDTAYPNIVNVTWHQSSVDTSAYLVCVETSKTGNVSKPDSLFILLKKFCPWALEDFTGTWAGSETGDSDTTLLLSIVHDPADGDNVLRVKAIADTNSDGGIFAPPFLLRLFDIRGERFVDSIGNEGDVLLHVNLISGKIIIENDLWGETMPGKNHYWTGGEGSWCGCSDSINLDFEMYWSTDFSKPNKTSTVKLKKQ